MSHPDNVARLREIKRLLDRIQQLPHIAGIPNGVPNGFHAGPRPPGGAHDPEPDDEAVRSPLGRGGLPLGMPLSDDLPRVASRALVPVQPKPAGGLSPWVFVAATVVNAVVAATMAVVITLTVARRDPALPPALPEAEKVMASVRPLPEPQTSRPVELLPVGSPAEPLRLEAAKPARLPLQIRPAEAMRESYILILSGLPENTTLFGASRMGGDRWLVPPGALPHIEIVVPEWSASTIEVGAELRSTSGAVVAQSRLWLAVPPPATPQAARLSETALRDLVKSGDRLLDRGDVVAARAQYEKAAAMGSAQAALAMGATYDPRRLWSLGVFGPVGNKERARQWYQRAAELGHPEANARLGALK